MQVLKPGSSVVTTNIELADAATGKLLAQGTHIKVHGLPRARGVHWWDRGRLVT